MNRISSILMIAVFAVMNACSGGITPPDNTCKVVDCNPPPPPPVETVNVSITSPTQGQVLMPTFASWPTITLSLSANASSTTTGTINNLAWTVDGQPATTSISVGSHVVCVTATAPSGKTANTCNNVSAVMPGFVGSFRSISPTLSFPVQDFVPSGGKLIFGEPGLQDTVQVVSDGRNWAIQSRWALRDTVKVCPVSNGSIPCTKPILVLKKDFLALNIVTAPAVVTIPSGLYAGQQVTISLEKARAGLFDGSFSFYVMNPTAYVGSYTSYPVPVAFCRSLSNMQITASDSVAFWTHLNSSNSVFGRQIFKSANESEVCQTQTGIRVIINTNLTRDGGAVDNWGSRDYVSGLMQFVSTNRFTLSNFFAQHEGIHALGFGHTCSWSTIMYTCLAPDNNQTTISKEDVGYILLMMAVSDEMRKLNTFYSILGQQ